MKKFTSLLVLCFVLAVPVESMAQKMDIDRQVDAAIKLMDDEFYAESEQLLKSAIAYDSKNYRAQYELGYLYYLKSDYAKAIKQMKKAATSPDAHGQLYQLMGNAYDLSGDAAKAIATYKEGLKKFPGYGGLYYEMATMTDDFNEALDCHESGIMADPTYLSNYYYAAALLLDSTEPVWGLMYGEIFMLLESSTDRTVKMSKAMYDAYNKYITIGETDGKRSADHSLTRTEVLYDEEDFYVPYPLVYADLMMKALPEDAVKLDLATLDKMRQAFVAGFFDPNGEVASYADEYGNVLLDHQKLIAEAGHMEAYNYWLLQQGDPEAYKAWREEHVEEFDAFVEWYNSHGLNVDMQKRYSMSHY